MNRQKLGIPILMVVLALLLLPVQNAEAQDNRTFFTGAETFLEDLSPGEETFPAEKLYHVRDALSRFALETSDPRVNGENQAVINWNFRFVDPPVFVTGPMWGTFQITNSGGGWEGTWSGKRDENGFSFFRFTGKGTGGYEGLILHFQAERLSPDPTQPEMISGFIVEAGG